MLQRTVLVHRRTDAAAHDVLGGHCHRVARIEGHPMKPEELISLAEKYEAWAIKFAGMDTPTCQAREYRAIAAGLRMLAGQDTRPDRTSQEK